MVQGRRSKGGHGGTGLPVLNRVKSALFNFSISSHLALFPAILCYESLLSCQIINAIISKPYLSGCLNYYRKFYYLKFNRTFRRKTNDISLLFKQRKHTFLIVNARTFSRPTEVITESCFLKQAFLKNMRNPGKITANDFPFH